MNGIQNENWNLTCAPTPSFYADTPLTHSTEIQERELESHVGSHFQQGFKNENWNLSCYPTFSFYANTPLKH